MISMPGAEVGMLSRCRSGSGAAAGKWAEGRASTRRPSSVGAFEVDIGDSMYYPCFPFSGSKGRQIWARRDADDGSQDSHEPQAGLDEARSRVYCVSFCARFEGIELDCMGSADSEHPTRGSSHSGPRSWLACCTVGDGVCTAFVLAG